MAHSDFLRLGLITCDLTAWQEEGIYALEAMILQYEFATAKDDRLAEVGATK